MEIKSEINVSGLLTLDDYKQYTRYHTKVRQLISFLIIFVVLILVNLRNLDTLDIATIFFVFIFSVIFSGLLLLYMRFITMWRFTKEYKSDQLIQREIHYTFNEDGVIQQNGRSRSYIEWHDIRKGYEHPDMYLLYLSKNKAIVLPKDFFDDGEHRRNFRSLLKKCLGDRTVGI